jgi:hypothetical protein
MKSKNIKAISIITICSIIFNACSIFKIDEYHVLIRSDVIKSAEDEKAILNKAKLTYSSDGKLPILIVKGNAYERGYQHGVLLRNEVQDNLKFLYKNMLKTFRSEELFTEAFERMRPYISEEYMEEMHGLAHGAKLPLKMIHHIHTLPEISEWGGKKRLKELAKRMFYGEDLGTSCSNFSLLNKNADNFLTVRILDWGLHRISKLHQYPLITVNIPNDGIASANIGWVGFLGAVSGMNQRGITLGEMGHGSPPNETLRGKPMIFLLREVLSNARNLEDVRNIIGKSKGTNSYVYLMSSGETKEAELYVRDAERFLVFKPGETIKENEEYVPAIKDVVYGGHFTDKMHKELLSCNEQTDKDYLIKKVIPEIVMDSNFQNVVYEPDKLNFWVSYAKDAKSKASSGEYSFISLKDLLNSN